MGSFTLSLMQLTDIDPKIYQKDKFRSNDAFNVTNILFDDLIRDLNGLEIDTNFVFTCVSDFVGLIEKDVVNILNSCAGYSYAGNVYLNLSDDKVTSPFGLTCNDIENVPIDVSFGKSNQRDILIWNAENFYSKDIEKNADLDGNSKILTSGIPGWHFQDYEITRYVFNGIYDMHGGARELLYPHHEFIDEISKNLIKSKQKTSTQKSWIHIGLVNINSEKMSNSLGNTILISDILKKYNPNVLKIFFLCTYYKDDIEFTIKDLEYCEFIDKFITTSLLEYKDSPNPNVCLENQLKIKFIDLLQNDYDTKSIIKLILKVLDSYRNPRLIRWMLEILGLRYY